MNNDDYKTEFEEHRKEIHVDDHQVGGKLPSRSDLHGKRRKSSRKSKHFLINSILAVFTLIPIVIFAVVIINYNQDKKNDLTAKVDQSNEDMLFKVESKEPKEPKQPAGSDDEAEENVKKETVAKVPVDVNPKGGNEKEKSVQKKQPSNAASQPAPKPKPAPQPAPKPEPKPPQSSKVHIVSPNETLYRISINYYGSDAGIEKIKQANGLSSNEIIAGQQLIIP